MSLRVGSVLIAFAHLRAAHALCAPSLTRQWAGDGRREEEEKEEEDDRSHNDGHAEGAAQWTAIRESPVLLIGNAERAVEG